MITAIVRYRLPATIGREACQAHFAAIAPEFGAVPGLIRKQFLWSESGTAGGVYQWESLDYARRFYQGPWLGGILARYGTYPDIEYFTTLAVTDNPGGEVSIPSEEDTPIITKE
jgi:hypothetical protein